MNADWRSPRGLAANANALKGSSACERLGIAVLDLVSGIDEHLRGGTDIAGRELDI